MTPAIARLSATAMFAAPMRGMLNVVPKRIKPVVKGDRVAVKKLSPAVSCHHG